MFNTFIIYFWLVLDIYLTEEEYQARESDMVLEVTVCKSKSIAFHPFLFYEIEAIISAMLIENVTIPLFFIADSPYSPSRAGKFDAS